MITPTNYIVPDDLLKLAVSSIPKIDSRLALNQPTGLFFNDPWEIKPEFKGTVWETILDILDEPKGEARLIKLAQGVCYPSHADIDDRWHLGLVGNNCYLIDLEKNIMHKVDDRGKWFSMDAGVRHSAANFGSCDRVQLVIRKLLPKIDLLNCKEVEVKIKEPSFDQRYIFDDIVSPWLNRAFKRGIVSNFKPEANFVSFYINEQYIKELEDLSSEYFTLVIKN